MGSAGTPCTLHLGEGLYIKGVTPGRRAQLGEQSNCFSPTLRSVSRLRNPLRYGPLGQGRRQATGLPVQVRPISTSSVCTSCVVNLCGWCASATRCIVAPAAWARQRAVESLGLRLSHCSYDQRHHWAYLLPCRYDTAGELHISAEVLQVSLPPQAVAIGFCRVRRAVVRWTSL